MEDNKKDSIKYIESKSGHANITINEIYIHSNLDPLKEAQEIIERVEKTNTRFLILGLGAGHLVNELLESLEDNPSEIRVIEPYKSIINEYKKNYPEQSKKVIFHNNDNLEKLYHSRPFIDFIINKPTIIKLETVYEIKKDYFKKLLTYRSSQITKSFKPFIDESYANLIKIEHEDLSLKDYFSYVQESEPHITSKHLEILAFNEIISKEGI